jgi:hypothetical protein
MRVRVNSGCSYVPRQAQVAPQHEFVRGSHWGDIFDPNGTLRTSSMGHKSTGKWRIQKDQLCLDRGQEPGGGCYEVWVSGKRVELRDRTAGYPLEGVLQKPTDR